MGVGLFSSMGSIVEEYDPVRPNDYETTMKERERKRIEAAREADRLAKEKENERRQQVGSRSSRWLHAVCIVVCSRGTADYVSVGVCHCV